MKSISTGDAVSVGCWKNEKTRNRIPLLMELMDTRVFEVHWKEGLLQCQRQVLDRLNASIKFGILPRLASIPAISKLLLTRALTSVLMQIFREKSLSGRTARRRRVAVRGGRRRGRGQVQRDGLRGRRGWGRQPRGLRRLHHRHGRGGGRAGRRRRGGLPRRAGEVERLHLRVRRAHLGVRLYTTFIREEGNVKPLF